MAKFFNKFKKLFLTYFGGKNFFKKKKRCARDNFKWVFNTIEKTKDTIPRKRLDEWKEGRADTIS